LHQLSGKGSGEALTNPKASSATFYEKGAWALFILRDQIGDTAFRRGIKEYLQKYQYGNATVPDFMEVMEKSSGMDLTLFKEEWLQGSDFPFAAARETLKKRSPSLDSFFGFQRELITSNGKIRDIIAKYWNAGIADEFKREIIFNYGRSLSEDFIKDILLQGNIRVRQAVAISLEKVPETLKEEFTTLLDDESYVTQENALYKLWVHFPSERPSYLDALDGVIGLPNINIRLLWLTLALITKDYQVKNKPIFLGELLGYTAPRYPFEVRMGAFQYIGDTVGYSDKNLLDLVNACTHHSWQFQKFARAQLEAFMEKETNKNRLIGIKGKLKGEELRYLNSKLK
jgi:aminopeptidase N